jgi:hypothetical protein
MNGIEKQFLQTIIKPMNDLQARLIYPYLYSSEGSSLAIEAGNIAQSISHFPEQMHSEKDAKEIKNFLGTSSSEYQLMRDFCDTKKHRVLKKECRIVICRVRSRFEIREENKFRFIQTVPTLIRPNQEKALENACDFTDVAKVAAEHLSEKLELPLELVQFIRPIPEEVSDFSDTIRLYNSNKSGEVSVKDMSIEIVKKIEGGKYLPVNAPFSIEVIDCN